MKINAFLIKTGQLIQQKWQSVNRFAGSQAVEVIEWEYEELQHIFGLLVLGSFVGLPSPPLQITLDLIPDMEKELHLMLEKVDTASSPLSELFSLLNIG
jgi:hypothetical protein